MFKYKVSQLVKVDELSENLNSSLDLDKGACIIGRFSMSGNYYRASLENYYGGVEIITLKESEIIGVVE